jgi:hypothetical protein
MWFLLLGLIDFLLAVLMLLAHLEIFSAWRIAIAALIFWTAKGIIYRGSFLSVIDLLAGVYFILVMLGVRSVIVYLFLAFMIYKFSLSLMFRG